MKKIKKNDLRLDKEVISSLSGNDLAGLRGGDAASLKPPCWSIPSGEPGCESRNPTCPATVKTVTCMVDAPTKGEATCQHSKCICMPSAQC